MFQRMIRSLLLGRDVDLVANVLERLGAIVLSRFVYECGNVIADPAMLSKRCHSAWT